MFVIVEQDAENASTGNDLRVTAVFGPYESEDTAKTVAAKKAEDLDREKGKKEKEELQAYMDQGDWSYVLSELQAAGLLRKYIVIPLSVA